MAFDDLITEKKKNPDEIPEKNIEEEIEEEETEEEPGDYYFRNHTERDRERIEKFLKDLAKSKSFDPGVIEKEYDENEWD